MAPVLGMLFTPLFAVMLAVSAVVYAATGLGDAFDRDLVSVFDALLVVVLALTGRTRLHRLERWQTTYLPVFALWAAAVVVVLPPLFTFD